MKKIWTFLERPQNIFLLAVALGALGVGLHMSCCYSIYRDVAGCYAPLTREFAAGNFAGAFHPALPPLNIFCAGVLAYLTGLEAFSAVVAISGGFYLLTMWPLAAILRRWFPDYLAAIGVLLYATAPKLVRFANAGLLESGKIFFTILAIALILRIWDAPRRWRMFIALGAALGGLALVRGEGFALAGALGIAMLAGAWRPAVGARGRLLLQTALAALTALAVMSPKLYENYVATGYPVPDYRVVVALQARAASGTLQAVDKPARELVSIGELAAQNIRGGYELYAALAAVGLTVLALGRRRREIWGPAGAPTCARWHNEWWLLLLPVVLNGMIHYMSFAAYRYFLGNILFFMPLTLIGATWAVTWTLRLLDRRIVTLLVAAILTAQLANGFRNLAEGRDEYRTGVWLRNHYTRFAPEGQRPVMFAVNTMPEWYFSGMARAIAVETPLPDPLKFTDFDLMMVRRKDAILPALRQRRDLQELALPDSCSKVAVFKRIKKGASALCPPPAN